MSTTFSTYDFLELNFKTNEHTSNVYYIRYITQPQPDVLVVIKYLCMTLSNKINLCVHLPVFELQKINDKFKFVFTFISNMYYVISILKPKKNLYF